MTRLNSTRFALSVLLTGSALAAVVPTQAQPLMGEMGVYRHEGRMHERMAKHWEQRQAELKTKLQLTAAQEPAWNAFVQGLKMPTKPQAQAIDREALVGLSTPERLDKMNAAHEANLAAMQTHIRQRAEATRTFYGQLSAEQQKVFDTQTLPEQGHWKGQRN